jgi:hypothetical protein
MKYLILLPSLFIASILLGQNVGINQNSPTNSLHISPINSGDDPLRIDNMQSYVSGDTTLMIIDNTSGIVRYVAKSDLGGMIGDILFQNSTFTDSLNTYVTNNTGSDTDVDSARVVGNTLQIFENGTMITADLTNVTGTTYTGGTGIGISGSTITNTAPDQTVSITGGGSTTVTGTYPNFTVSSTDNQTLGSNATSITLTNGGSVPFSTVNANDWHTIGNAGTNVTTNFLGTTDNVALALRTNNTERMRIAAGGAVTVNTTTASGVFTSAAGGTDNAIVGVATNGAGVIGQTNFATNFGMSARNNNATGTGIIASGNNQTGNYLTSGTGGAFTGDDGSYSKAATTNGTGVIGLGNNLTTASTYTTGTGGAFTGNDGLYAVGILANGTGVIGGGNNLSTTSSLTLGSGGAFTGNAFGVYGKSNNTTGSGLWGVGVIGDGVQFGVFSLTNLGANGTKSFIIDHPLDPENKFLKHYSMESPEVINFYRGNITLDANGNGTVELPDYFTSINTNYSYTLTPIGSPSVTYIAEEIDENGTFKIAGGNSGQKISWYVYAERNDVNIKNNDFSTAIEVQKNASQKGKYLNPAAYGKTNADAIFQTKETESVQRGTSEAPVTITTKK